MRILIKNAYVATLNAGREVIEQGHVAVRGTRIESVGPAASAPPGPYDRVIEASGLIVTPGLVNLHQHPWMNLVKGLADGMLLEPWVFRFIQPFLDALTLEDVRASAYLSGLEMLRTGTTCFLDHTTRLPQGYEAALIEPMAQLGIRHVFAKQFQCRTPKLPDYPLSAQEAREEAAALVARHHGASDGLTRMALAIECNAHHTELGKSSDELVCTGYELAREKDLRIPVHVSGGTLSMSMGFLKYLRATGRRDVAYLEKLGVLDHHWLLKHGIHFSDGDIASVRERGAHVVYTPTSEAIRGGGFGPIAKLHRAGVNCALGSDGPAVDYSVDMVEQMKACVFLQNLKHCDAKAMSPETALEMATLNGAEALGLGSEIGSIEPGKLADLAMFDLNAARPQVIHDPVHALVLGMRGTGAHTVLVNGKVLVAEGKLVGFEDADEVVAEAIARGRDVARRSGLARLAETRWAGGVRATA